MFFKVAFIKNSLDNISFDRKNLRLDCIMDCNLIENFYCFKINNISHVKKKGVIKSDETTVPAEDFIISNEGRSMTSLSFVFVNKQNKRVYYNSSDSRLKEILLNVFYTHTNDINYEVDSNKLVKIQSLTFEAKNHSQMSLFDSNIEPNLSIENELEIMDSYRKSIMVKCDYGTEGRVFNRKNLDKILKTYPNISINGLDTGNNSIIIKDIIQLGIDLSLDDSTYEKINNISFKEFVSEINKKEKETLNEY